MATMPKATSRAAATTPPISQNLRISSSFLRPFRRGCSRAADRLSLRLLRLAAGISRFGCGFSVAEGRGELVDPPLDRVPVPGIRGRHAAEREAQLLRVDHAAEDRDRG